MTHTEHDPTRFTAPRKTEYQVQHMTEEFEVWNTLETYNTTYEAKEHAKDYAKGNPQVEVQIVKTMVYNY